MVFYESELPRVPKHEHQCKECKVKFSCERNCECEGSLDRKMYYCYCPTCWLLLQGQSLHWYKRGCWSSYSEEEIKIIQTLEEL